ncbi:DNA polymerase iota isoform X6 [Monodelphis domestica]|uniref:DNA polymerase iota isoform X6 n=1 Tax=Monodelphis domestica TaxID=13616 RepID=UPI0007B40256|nr:DNA polymerase iota isoform X6 [Monodelphis domestica]
METLGVEPEEEDEEEEDEEEDRMEPLLLGAAGGAHRALGPKEAIRPAPFRNQVVSAGSASYRVIVHVDLDCFYAQVEMISHPELKGKPLGVQQKYLVVTCNYEARKLGVKKLMSVRDAKEKCPQLVLVNGEDLTRYREMSYKVTELLEEFSPVVERLGFDENFVDVTQTVEKRLQQLQSDDYSGVVVSGHVYNNQSVNLNDILHVRLLIGSQIAEEMREAIFNQLGLTGCAGVASNKLLSKLVSGTFKPNQQTVLMPESCQDLIDSLDHIKQMPGIGFKTTKRLESLGINSVHDLQTFSPKILEKELGISVAQRIQKLSFGEDNSPVTPSGPPQKMKDTHLEEFSQDKEVNWDFLPSGRIESIKTGESPLDTANFTKEKEIHDFPLHSLPEGIDHEVFKELPVDIQEEILSGKTREKNQGKGSLSCPLHASKGVLSFFSSKQMHDIVSNPRDHLSSSKQLASISTSEPGTSGLSSSGSTYLFSRKESLHYLDSELRDERMSQGPKESQGFHFSNTNPSVSIFHSFPNLQSQQLFSKNHTADSHKQLTGSVSQHLSLTENREQESAEEEITFPSGIDPAVFFELPEDVQKELLAEWKRTGSSFQTVRE